MSYQRVRALVPVRHDGVVRIPGQTTGENLQDFVVRAEQATRLIQQGLVSYIEDAQAPATGLEHVFVDGSGRLRNPRGDAVGGGDVVLIDSNVTISPDNQAVYMGRTLEWTVAAVVTLAAGLAEDFGFNAIPPAAGNASIARATGVTLNGGTTTLTRAAASNALFAVVQRASNRNAYIVTGA